MLNKVGFTLLELLVVLTIVGLAISMIAIRLNSVRPSDEVLIRMFIMESLKIAKEKKTEVLIISQKNGIVSSDGRRLDIDADGSCVVKPSGKIILCHFSLRDKKFWITDVDY